MKKYDKNYLIIIIFCLIALYLVIPENAIFGSRIDWVSQHIVFPDYFRKLFYSTGNLFPNFALSIGAGQNIYNFSYYGLLNPIMMFSYLLPFVSMKDYIIVTNVILYIFFGLTLYYFLKSKYRNNISLLTTFIILLAGPILFHFHKHFMFVDYLPFLMLGLIGTDQYFKNGEKNLLIISTFLLVMISYYYSVFSIAVLCIYALYKYLEKVDKITIKNIIVEAFKYLIPIFIGILMSSILLLPTMYVLLTGRGDATKTVDLITLIAPKFNISSILYDNYSLGLTAIAVLSLFYFVISKKRENKYLGIIFIIIISIPIFIYLLNGKLYFRNKVLIPFIPLFGLMIGNFINDLIDKKINLFKLLLFVVILIPVSLLCLYFNVGFYIDIIILLTIIYIYYKDHTNKIMLSIVLLIAPITTMFISNSGDLYVSDKSKILEQEKNDKKIKKVLSKETNLVRFNNLDDTLENVNEVYIDNYNQDSLYSSVSNPLYQKFYKKTFHNALSYRNNLVLAQNNDILFQMFMGVKYIYSSENILPVGYEKISDNIYKNDNVKPMFFGTSSLTNRKIFDKLSYPYNVGTLLNSVVVNNKSTKDITNGIQEIKLDYSIDKQNNIKIEEKDSYIKIKSKDKGKLVLNLNKSLNKDILIIRVKLRDTPSCEKGDGVIKINGITNVLTCKEWMYKNRNKIFNYVISSNEDLNKLNIEFAKNNYIISDIKTYELKYDDIYDIKNNLSEFIVDKKNSKGDKIQGYIEMNDNGYFVTSIPYDKGFKVYVDNKVIKSEIVNTSFLGFKLNKGSHHIKIKYRSPWFNEGKYLSIIGCIFFIIIFFSSFSKKNKDS